MGRIKKILVPVDFSTGSNAAIDLANEIGGVLDLVHVWEPPAFADPEMMPGSVGSQGALARVERERAELDLQAIAEGAKERGASVGSVRILHGSVARTIWEFAESEAYDLIAMGTQGHSGLAHVLLGSVTEKVVRHSKVPVLTVRAPPS